MATTKVTNRVLADNSVGVAQLSAGAVTEAKIADNAVTEAKIANNAVSLNKLITTIQQALLPVGAVQAFAKTTVPAGWLSCNGDAVPTTGTVQGIAASSLTNLRNMLLADSSPFGTSSGNPLLPDLRGYFVRGHGTNSDGTASVGNFGRKQVDTNKSHSHGASTNSRGSHSHRQRVMGATATPGAFSSSKDFARSAGAGDAYAYSTTTNATYITSTTTTTTDGDHTHNITVNSDGGNESRPKNISLLYCIKY